MALFPYEQEERAMRLRLRKLERQLEAEKLQGERLRGQIEGLKADRASVLADAVRFRDLGMEQARQLAWVEEANAVLRLRLATQK